MTETDPCFDIAIIGGGVNGCGIARDAAGRGARVLLLERGDLAQGTSSASTKLIHGGLRYLEHHEFALVREALAERERLWRIAPHIIRPMRFVLPHRPGLRPRWMLRAGLFLYDHMGGRRALPATQTLDLRNHIAGAPLKADFRHGYAYSDGWVDDARLVILNARAAADAGAQVETRIEARRLERRGSLWHIHCDGGRRFIARVIVNAAGPSVLDLLACAGLQGRHGVRLVRGSHIVVPRLFAHDFAYFLQLPDGRIFFAIPYEGDFTLIGTTDRDHVGSVDHVRASEEEIRYLCDGVNQYFQRQIGPADVVHSYAGVRPLVDEGSGKPEAATRGYVFELDAADGQAPMLSVFGGKITTYRHLAEAALARLRPFVPALEREPWTAYVPLPGGDFPMTEAARIEAELARSYPFLSAVDTRRIMRAYGTCAWEWLGNARSRRDLGEDFGHGLSEAEVAYLVAREWARSAEDIMWRRTKIGLRASAAKMGKLRRHMKEGTT